MSEETVKITNRVYCDRSDKSICIGFHRNDKDAVHLPYKFTSMIPAFPDRGDPVTVTIPRWLAEKEGLI